MKVIDAQPPMKVLLHQYIRAKGADKMWAGVEIALRLFFDLTFPMITRSTGGVRR